MTGLTLLELLDLERIDRDLFRASVVFSEPYALYGGQVAAQALRAAGATVPADRAVHSLHGYYLRRGDAARPTVFRVYRDRDGRSYTARRVVALQDGEVILSMSASFHVQEDGPDIDAVAAPIVPGPSEPMPENALPRLFSMQARIPPAPYPGAEWPTRLWTRCTDPLPDDPLVHACVLTYVSDTFSGLAAYHDDKVVSGTSLDHAVWFHRPVRMDDWVLIDLVPHTVARGRGFYSGTLRDGAGILVASLTQENLFRTRAAT